ncbi:putative carbamoyl transferase, NodU family [Luteitalea pratensis]|uniref:Putative carbamoyl transferase, NodU family n=1 Tax=Luteitalea pratensis TaxID=1855912 RepID=A0A143PNV3_LUTPR|nr:putative carbamoyl transferase, NodU family [Luteitalea pratensis]
MITLALGGWHSHGAAAVGSRGRLLAALDAGSVVGVREIGLLAVPDPWVVAARCLAAAGASWDEVAQVCLVTDTPAVGGVAQVPADVEAYARGRGLVVGTATTMDADRATRAFAETLEPGQPVLYAGIADAWLASDGGLVHITGYGDLAAAAARLSAALGQGRREPWHALQSLAEGRQPEARWDGAMRPVMAAGPAAVDVAREALERLIADASATVSVALDSADSPHVGAQMLRAALASAFLVRVREILNDVGGDGRAIVGGRVGTLPAVSRHRLADVLPCPDARGAVIGAAIGALAPGEGVRLQGIGENFSEADVKLALESSRLDYLYEPRPERLMDRISALLAAGKLVAWFEGRADFGDVPCGSRVVVADAAERYSRDNVNVYLRHRSVDSLLTVMLTAATATRIFGDRAPAPGQRARLTVPPAHTAAFDGAANKHGIIDLVVACDSGAPGFHQLLAHHEARTGHPALVVSRLAAADGAVAARPIDALAVTYTTPLDALVMGRFVVFKDYWLLRSGTPTA